MSRPIRILVVEDSEDDARLALRELSREGFEPAYERVDTPAAMKAALDSREWDIVISDYSMPGFDAPEALRILQEKEIDIPFIVFSGSIGEETAVEIMKAGACDYVMKDNMKRLCPAVEREIREAAFRRAHDDAIAKMCEQAALLDISPSAFIVRDGEERIQFWSRGAERLYGWPKKDVIGSGYCEILCSEDRPSCHEEVLHALTENGSWSGECRHRTHDGKPLIVESRWLLMDAAAGSRSSTLIVNTDVTEKKALEAQLFRSQRLESIGALASGIAHDMNNILAPISMASEILMGTYTDKDSRRILDILKSSADRGANLTRQVLSFVRGLEGERTLLHADKLFAEVEAILRATIPKNIAIRIDAPKNLPAVSGNCTQLIQVLMNLCVNARDAMPSGGTMHLSARNVAVGEGGLPDHPKALPGRYTMFSVSDTGTGIPSDVLERIFDPFFTTKAPGKGTGLGLSTVSSIVKAHDGFFAVSSRPGEGTRFDIYLPAADEAREEISGKRDLASMAGHGEVILVVDDEASILEIAKATLEAFGFRVLTANNGAEGLAAYRQNLGKVSAVIVDRKMPVLDGPETIRSLREIDPRVKIILSTGGGTIESGHGVLAVNAELSKPYSVPKFIETLKGVLAQPL